MTIRSTIIAVAAFAVVMAVPAGAQDNPAETPGPARGLPDSDLSPLSMREQALGETRLAAGDLGQARDHFESALAADPRNRQAFLGLARIAEAQNLPGKAARYYREALDLNPNDPATLELQGQAYLKRGATKMAEDNLARLKTLCEKDCTPADRLTAAIDRQKAASDEDRASDEDKAADLAASAPAEVTPIQATPAQAAPANDNPTGDDPADNGKDDDGE